MGELEAPSPARCGREPGAWRRLSISPTGEPAEQPRGKVDPQLGELLIVIGAGEPEEEGPLGAGGVCAVPA